jgi:tellurite methyltransferase
MKKRLLLVLCLFSLFSCLFYIEASQGKWDKYYDETMKATKPWPTLKLAYENFNKEGKTNGLAVDLGSGSGTDSLFLLKNGWNVHAYDQEALAIQILLNRVPEQFLGNLETVVIPFYMMELPVEIDLVNASFSLPFCAPEDFPAVWENIVEHMAVGGRFAGHLFGDKDDWAVNPNYTFHTHEQMLALFKDRFVIESLKVEEGMDKTATGNDKYWHVYHIVAKKIK